jgi:hypothetical protein
MTGPTQAAAAQVLIIALFGMFSVTQAASSPGPWGRGVSGASTADGKSPAAGEAGPPVCVRIGTRSEGWAWPSGHFIHWAKCKGVRPKCEVPGEGLDVEGWYGGGVLIVPAHCAAAAKKP